MRYKVGDVVRITKNINGHGFEIGQPVEIKEVKETYYIAESWMNISDDWAIDDREIVD